MCLLLGIGFGEPSMKGQALGENGGGEIWKKGILRWQMNRCKGPIWWQDLKKICKLEDDRGQFARNVHRDLGDGRELSFWEGRWVGEEALKNSYHKIFLNSTQQGSIIKDMGRWVGKEWQWCFSWKRLQFQWENILLITFMQVLDAVKPCRDCQDNWEHGCKALS